MRACAPAKTATRPCGAPRGPGRSVATTATRRELLSAAGGGALLAGGTLLVAPDAAALASAASSAYDFELPQVRCWRGAGAAHWAARIKRGAGGYGGRSGGGGTAHCAPCVIWQHAQRRRHTFAPPTRFAAPAPLPPTTAVWEAGGASRALQGQGHRAREREWEGRRWQRQQQCPRLAALGWLQCAACLPHSPAACSCQVTAACSPRLTAACSPHLQCALPHTRDQQAASMAHPYTTTTARPPPRRLTSRAASDAHHSCRKHCTPPPPPTHAQIASA